VLERSIENQDFQKSEILDFRQNGMGLGGEKPRVFEVFCWRHPLA